MWWRLTSLSGPDIRISRLDQSRALEHLPDNVQQEEDTDTGVGGEEASQLVGSPSALGFGEGLEAVEQDDEHEEGEGRPGGVGLEG